MADGAKVGDVIVEIREVYGVRKAYPVSASAKVAAKLAGTVTLGAVARELCRDLGLVVSEAYGRSLEGVA
jgi:hypothetical protein